MATLAELKNATPEMRRDAAKRVVQVLVGGLFIGGLIFLSAWTFAWSWGWVCVGLTLVTYIVGVLILPLDVIAERGAHKENQEGWDKVVSVVLAPATFAIYIVAGLDFRFGWSGTLATGWHVAGLALYVTGVAFMEWALMTNHFFSTAVRLQFDRGHTVCMSGPYRLVRHPGYVGMIVFWPASALVLGSWWALVPAVLVVAALVMRTALEDRTLKERLPGYPEYAQRVRYRLVPGIW